MGQFTEVEVRSARGRADAVVKTPKYIYVFEFKLNGTAEQALQQIDEKGYLIPYQADDREVVKVGVECGEKEYRSMAVVVRRYARHVFANFLYIWRKNLSKVDYFSFPFPLPVPFFVLTSFSFL